MNESTTPMQQLLQYIKNANAVTFLPEQLAKTIEEKYLPIEKSTIIQTFDMGEMNIWNSKRDESFEYEGGIDFFNQNYK